MLDDLLAGARAQAERSEPPVRAAALLRIARVQTAFDRVQARLTFQQALDETRLISGRDGEFLLEQARLLAAAMAPEHLVESLIGEHEQLATAARRFPNGMESVMEAAQPKCLDRLPSRAAPNPSPDPEGAVSEPPSRHTKSRGYGMAGSPRDFPYMQSLLQASEDGDFLPVIEHALEQYRRDASPDNPNQSLREFWPSTCRFRGILYRAGKRLGRDAAVYLDRIPDNDLRLFAQIELAAALAGLPELQGQQREYRPATNTPAS